MEHSPNVKKTAIRHCLKLGSREDLTNINENDVKSPLLPPKPGRRPPSIIFKDGELGVVNGNVEHISLDGVSEEIANAQITDSTEIELAVKPKVREWEKHKAPWFEEMKLNQAKRTSTSPEQSRLKLTPTDESISPEIEDSKSNKLSPFDKTSFSPIDMSKSMSAISTKPKISPNELDKNVALRSRPSHWIPQSSQKRQSLTNLSENQIQKSKATVASHGKVMDEKVTDVEVGEISSKQYLELLPRIDKLETFVYQQNQLHQNAIEELKGKLQLETDMRRLLQAELDKISQCVMQV
ncbi:hypothetical protein FQA39_LY09581 [Lamprigera yunnana]|nr:hypothetical protein FQA39_LY09581 [Lamprigera yunnana]